MIDDDKLDKYLGSDWIKKDDVRQRALRGLITDVEEVAFDDRTGGRDEKLAIVLDDDRRMALNRTNARVLADALGKPSTWVGAIVKVYFEPGVWFGGSQVGGLRLKVLRTKEGTAPGGAAPPPAPVPPPAPAGAPARPATDPYAALDEDDDDVPF
jgi:hypothetical protein